MTETKKNTDGPENVASFVEKRRTDDNPLLDALKQVIESNAEYARGVSTLLDADLEREILLTEIKNELSVIKSTLVGRDEEIDKFNGQILLIINKLEDINTSMSKQIIEKLAPLYIAANLQVDGKEYNPTDKLVLGFQSVLASRLFTIIASIVIYLVAKMIFSSYLKV